MKRDQSSSVIVKNVVAIGRLEIFHKKEEKLATAAAMIQNTRLGLLISFHKTKKEELTSSTSTTLTTSPTTPTSTTSHFPLFLII